MTLICKSALFFYIISLKLESVSQRITISVTFTASVRKFLSERYSSCGQLILGEESANDTWFARGKM